MIWVVFLVFMRGVFATWFLIFLADVAYQCLFLDVHMYWYWLKFYIHARIEIFILNRGNYAIIWWFVLTKLWSSCSAIYSLLHSTSFSGKEAGTSLQSLTLLLSTEGVKCKEVYNLSNVTTESNRCGGKVNDRQVNIRRDSSCDCIYNLSFNNDAIDEFLSLPQLLFLITSLHGNLWKTLWLWWVYLIPKQLHEE